MVMDLTCVWLNFKETSSKTGTEPSRICWNVINKKKIKFQILVCLPEGPP